VDAPKAKTPRRRIGLTIFFIRSLAYVFSRIS
jgi:hypothetical protein